MSFYVGRYAELYDLFYSDKPYDEEAKEIDLWLKKYSTKKPSHLLELACGTGNHAFHLVKQNYAITALDYSRDMIVQAKKKNVYLKSSINFVRGDMRKLPKFGKKFDAAYCLFDSIGYVLTNENITKVLSEVKNNLKKEGLFIVEFWHAPAMLCHYEPIRKKTLTLPNRNIVKRISKTTINYTTNVASVQYNISEYNSKKMVSHLKETQQNRFFSIPEMKMILQTSGFYPLKFFAGFSNNSNITDKTWHVVVIAKRN